MTQVQQTAFMCNRCQHEAVVALNDQPSLERGKPPPTWTTMHINGPTQPAHHLCPDCTRKFETFMTKGAFVEVD